MVLTIAINGKWPNRMDPKLYNSSIFEDIRNSSSQSPQLMKLLLYSGKIRSLMRRSTTIYSNAYKKAVEM